MNCYNYSDELYHWGIKGMKWGVRRYRNRDNSLTPAGKERYDYYDEKGRGGKKNTVSPNNSSSSTPKSSNKMTVGEAKQKHRDAIDKIQNDKKLTDDAKRKAIASENTRYKKQLAELDTPKEGLSDTQKKVLKAAAVLGAVAVTSAVVYHYSKKGKASAMKILNVSSYQKVDYSKVQDDWLRSIGERGLCGGAKIFEASDEANKYNTTHHFSKKMWNRFTSDERVGVVAYTSNNYKKMNEMLRFDEYSLDNLNSLDKSLVGSSKSQLTKYIRDCTEALSKSTINEDIVVHRGIGDALSALTGLDSQSLKNPDVQKGMIGQVITEKGFCSTGGSVKDAWGGTKMHIMCPAGTKGMYVDPISEYKGEHEFLLQRNTSFEILDYKTDSTGKIIDIFVKVVSQL